MRRWSCRAAAQAELDSTLGNHHRVFRLIGAGPNHRVPDDFKGWTVQSLSVSFERPPKLPVISGVNVSPQDLACGKFRLSSEGTLWFATDNQGVACQVTTGEAQIDIK